MEFYRGRTALVTGASAGIGEAFARRLAAAGACVVLVSRSEDALRALAAELGGGAVALAEDLQQPGASARLAERLDAEGLAVDVLVNNAGVDLPGPFAAQDPDALEAMVALNCGALTGLTRRLLPGMLARRRGGVLNVASMAAFQPTVGMATYAATKAYVLRLTQALHYELKGTGVHASCLCPAQVPTRMTEGRPAMGPRLARGYTADDAARPGLRALTRNDREAALGWFNKVHAAATRLSPTALTLFLSERYAGAGQPSSP